MTPRQRLLTALNGGQPDHVPPAPDLFEMVPVRLLGRPSWEMLVYEDPPIWKARMDACAHYGVDAMFLTGVPMDGPHGNAVVYRDAEKLITRGFVETDEGVRWSPMAIVYREQEPSAHVTAAELGLPETHENYEVVTRNYQATGRAYFEAAREYVGERGIVGPAVSLPCLNWLAEESIRYCEDPEPVREEMQARGEAMMGAAKLFLSWKPDVLYIGNSGMMIFNPEPVFRDLGLEWLQKVTALAKEHGVPTHLHCCGAEADLVRIAAQESDLTGIEPLEPPPMGDCDLGEIKRVYGDTLSLKGNLHTTDVMLMGTPERVEEACKKAIDDAAAGGGFILSTGDQTPRDTPDINIETMRRVAETYGRY
jgi:uroporphyrinogen decarboxylase